MNIRAKILRCAVYTRKSTEEGLDQEFNSLDAQREACTAYIASQAGLGWTLVTDRYDDGGISGGTMERPALQRLLQDIGERRVDVVVVYKIDRLTRSLVDFSKMVEIFDQANASFVSITQQFNTTTSMGRLTLNVLLSFAQFEREVTAERIRDKIAASKKKGMWMGGVVPLGYRVENRKLMIEANEAKTVRHLFARYLKLKSVRALAEEAEATGLEGRLPSAGGKPGKPFGRGNLYHLLSNPVYIGKVRHHGEIFDGEHVPILEPQVFSKAQALLAAQAPRRAKPDNAHGSHLLTGILFDETGDRLSPTYATKNGKRYRYYVSNRLVRACKTSEDGWRVPAQQIEALVEDQLHRLLTNKVQLADWIQQSGSAQFLEPALAQVDRVRQNYEIGSPADKQRLLRMVFQRIELSQYAIGLEVNRTSVVNALVAGQSSPLGFQSPAVLDLTRINVPLTLRKRGVETKLRLASSNAASSFDPALVALIARAHCYLRKLTKKPGRTLTDVAAECGTEPSEVSRILPLAFLAPAIVEAVLAGQQPISLTTQRLLRVRDLPACWAKQAALLLESRTSNP